MKLNNCDAFAPLWTHIHLQTHRHTHWIHSQCQLWGLPLYKRFKSGNSVRCSDAPWSRASVCNPDSGSVWRLTDWQTAGTCGDIRVGFWERLEAKIGAMWEGGFVFICSCWFWTKWRSSEAQLLRHVNKVLQFMSRTKRKFTNTYRLNYLHVAANDYPG